jgi:protein TonB
MRRYAARANSDWQRPGPRQRAGVLGLTLLVELVLVLIVIAFGGTKVGEAILPSSPTQIVFVPNPAAPSPSPPQQRRAAEKAEPRPTPPAELPKPPPPVLPRAALPYIPMSKLDLAASDISKLGTAAGAPAATSGAAAGTGAAVGAGPGGVTLYNAEWVVEPSDAQLRTFLSRTVEAGSWALIACQTIAHNQVENCAQLGESPRGSGLAKAMRLAAWQFRVRPPRIDGKPMVGAWVRIRIDFGQAKGE